MKFLALILFLSSCQYPLKKEVKTFEVDKSVPKYEIPFDSKHFTENTIVIDIRKYFDFLNGHLKDAIPFQINEITFNDTFMINQDVTKISKQLSLKGIVPEKNIIIVGYGLKGLGEEGKLALFLKYLGFSKVNIIEESQIKGRRVTGPNKNIKNEKYWSPLISKEYFEKENLMNDNSKLIVVDESKTSINTTSIQIPWKNFLNKNGTINLNVSQELIKQGIRTSDKIKVYSKNGISSDLSTLVLNDLGYDAKTVYNTK